MVVYCAVYKCTNSSETPGIVMHRMPSNRFMKSLWIGKIKDHDAIYDPFVDGNRICSAHFKPEDYKQISNGRRKILKKNVEPSIFPLRKMMVSMSFREQEKAEEAERIAATPKSDFLEFWQAENSLAFDADYANLPDVILLQIFNHLKFEDRCRAGRVCHRWYNISKSPAVWTNVDLEVKSPYQVLKFLMSLPSNVKYLNISCQDNDIHNPLWLPDIICRLHERCPSIKTLILENIYFSQRFCNTGFTTDHVLHHSLEDANPDTSKSEWINHRSIPICPDDCCHSKISQDKYRPENRPQELWMLSLRHSHSFMCHLSSRLSQFFPKIKVLDLTHSVSIKDAVIPFFARLTQLEELYLVACPITNSGIENLLRHLKKLKVLDLEGSNGVNDETFEILHAYGHSLEKLYLGNTFIKSLEPNFAINETFLQLQVLCLRNTCIDNTFVSHLLEYFPNLECIDISFCNIHLPSALKDVYFPEKKVLFHKEGKPSICHHFKKEYM